MFSVFKIENRKSKTKALDLNKLMVNFWWIESCDYSFNSYNISNFISFKILKWFDMSNCKCSLFRLGKWENLMKNYILFNAVSQFSTSTHYIILYENAVTFNKSIILSKRRQWSLRGAKTGKEVIQCATSLFEFVSMQNWNSINIIMFSTVLLNLCLCFSYNDTFSI